MLGAIEHICIADLVGARGHLGGSTARFRFGDANGRLVAVQNQFSGALFLQLRAIGHNGADSAHIGLDNDPPGHAALFGHLLDHQNRIEIGQPLSAIGSRDRHPHKTGFRQLFNGPPRIGFAPVNLGGERSRFGFSECPRSQFQLRLGAGKFKHLNVLR
ncbi:hypothetical protein MnTg02_01070 [bacterium MnTg02]|nr:hypothetical protein MnTg02_01070 [bacterium MnTg02]